MSLRYKVISIFVLAVVLPAFLFGIVLTSISRKTIKNSIFYRQQETVRRIADRIDSQIEQYQKLLVVSEPVIELPRQDQIKALKGILDAGPAFSEITLLNSSAYEQLKYLRPGSVGRLSGRPRREFLKVDPRNPLISQVYFTGDRQPFIMIVVAFRSRKGFLFAKLDFNQVWKWIGEVKIGETGHAFLVDRKGNLIAHKEVERVLAHSNFSSLPVVSDFMNDIEPSPERWREYSDERGEQVVAMYQSLPKLGWAVVTQVPEKEVYAPIKKMYKSIFFWTVFWTAIFLVVGFMLVNQIIGPILTLEEGAKKIGTGKLDIKLDVRTGDELEVLAANFEKMAVSLKQLEELKQDLTRMIIHDLKSPLSGIMGSLDYLESGLLGELPQDQKRIITLAKQSSEKMLAMIQNLLDVAKMEEGKLDLKKEKFDLARLIEERIQQYGPLAAKENKQLSADVESGLPKIEAERHLIERVLNNLVSNALNHTASDGKIEVGARALEGFVEVRVSDNGAGIPPEYIDKIFEKFVQVRRREASLRTGAGLGLTFCRMVVETHGGKIRVESKLNRGSSFIFTLPV